MHQEYALRVILPVQYHMRTQAYANKLANYEYLTARHTIIAWHAISLRPSEVLLKGEIVILYFEKVEMLEKVDIPKAVI